MKLTPAHLASLRTWRASARAVWAFTIDLGIGDKLPTEFRIFARGENTATKIGSKEVALFDDKAARDVMAEFAAHGVDVMLDLEHLSLNPSAPNYDPDARGWAKLELRDGELWAVGVKWTDDGAQRLLGKRQRFASPAFVKNAKTNRVEAIVNIAITALPATDQAPALVAASQPRRTVMPRILAKLGALSSNDLKLAAAIMAAVEAATSAESPALKQLAGQVDAALDQMLGNAPDAPDGSEPAGEPNPEAAADAPPPAAAAAMPVKPGEEKKPMAASALAGDEKAIVEVARRVTGKQAAAEVEAALVGLSATKGSHGELAAEVAKLRAEADVRSVRDLVTANRGKVPPSLETWALKQSPAALAAFLEHAPVVVDVKAHREPEKKPVDDTVLTAADLELCKLTGAKPDAVLAEKKKLIAARAAGGN